MRIRFFIDPKFSDEEIAAALLDLAGVVEEPASGPTGVAPGVGLLVPVAAGRPVETAVRTAMEEGQILLTPTQRAPFTVARIDERGVLLLLGKGKWETRLSWHCLEGIPPYIRQHGGEVDIGGQHVTVGRPGTLDGYLKGCIKRTTAGWVAVLLEVAGIVEIVHERPARVRLV